MQNLTGGVLLLRNKFLIILYRGKDFVPSEVAKVVAEREMELTRCQLQEETARLKASEAFSITDEDSVNSGIVGTLSRISAYSLRNREHKKGRLRFEVQLESEHKKTGKEKIRDQERRCIL
ncbi:UNVERIFIED_CONTAM: Chloroplastic group IIA intron splicing facilitator CRS1, chloroplastic [Sesamum latifolium]|uniref:Chloroplastic group IIA intron splicing facilitator CRS1, chloroplastic n=1 Tax=Sesamum latifolium TaxID=2727402 RepID=A0AAW2X931_9LAMI